MHILHAFLLASATASLAAPSSSRRSLDGVEAGYSDNLEYRNFHSELIKKDFIELSEVLKARTGPFANIGSKPAEKTKAKDFLFSATHEQLENAAAGGTSAATVHSNDGFHLDRQQPSSARFKSKVAVQYDKVNKGKPSTVGQVVIPHGVNPKPEHVRDELKKSIDHGREHVMKETKKAGNINYFNGKKATKAADRAKSMAEGNARAKKGIFKKGNGKPSAKFTPLPPKWKKA